MTMPTGDELLKPDMFMNIPVGRFRWRSKRCEIAPSPL